VRGDIPHRLRKEETKRRLQIGLSQLRQQTTLVLEKK
jgi:hypothetical protein